MATVTPSYSSVIPIVMDLSGMNQSGTYVAGRESSQIDNSVTKYTDAFVDGRFIVGTTPIATGGINIFVWGANTSLATVPFDVLDGTDSAETITNITTLGAFKQACFMPILATTSNINYPIGGFHVAALFGGNMPKFWGLYVTQSTGVALKVDAGNTDSFNFIGIKYDIV